ncbi:cell division protein FtsB [Caldimonas tepidiphila]|uniref:cell division protein FtsB n=1 Tax=Caldimonas tepidiphila TaxID=2315841 RepID=UPI000E5B67FA|nr:cell division protein FtsB [Caldimonas tepidiphila]
MRLLTIALLAMLLWVHGELWFGRFGVNRVTELRERLETQEARNARARERNARLAAEVRDLKDGLEMVEERARYELGMVRPNEIYVHVMPPPAAPSP